MKSDKVTNSDWGGLIVLLVVAVLFWGYLIWFKSPTGLTKPADLEAEVMSGDTNYSVLAHLDFDSSLFAGKQYKGLKVYGQLPIKVELDGRSNPFKPLSSRSTILITEEAVEPSELPRREELIEEDKEILIEGDLEEAVEEGTGSPLE